MNILLRIFLVFLFLALPMGAAVNRTISIESPAQATAGSTVSVAVHARTDARDGEQVGFLHAEYSIDEGKTWTRRGGALIPKTNPGKSTLLSMLMVEMRSSESALPSAVVLPGTSTTRVAPFSGATAGRTGVGPRQNMPSFRCRRCRP